MQLEWIQDDKSNQDNDIANDISMVLPDAVEHVQSESAEELAKLATVEGGRLQHASVAQLHCMLSKIAVTTYMIDDQLSCVSAKSIVIPPALVTSLWAAKIDLHEESAAISLHLEKIRFQPLAWNKRDDAIPKMLDAAMTKLQSAREKIAYMSNKLIPPSWVHAWGDVADM